MLAGHVVALLGLAGLRLAWLDAILVVVSVPVGSSSLGAARLLRLLRVLRVGVALSASIEARLARIEHKLDALLGSRDRDPRE